jgi:hypothetical protein
MIDDSMNDDPMNDDALDDDGDRGFSSSYSDGGGGDGLPMPHEDEDVQPQTSSRTTTRRKLYKARDNVHALKTTRRETATAKPTGSHQNRGPLQASDLHNLASVQIGRPGFAILARLCGALRGFDPESTGMRIPLVDLSGGDIAKIDQLLGQDGVSINAAGDPTRKAYATKLPGVWRAHIEAPDGEVLFEWIEIGDIPSFVRELAVADANGVPFQVTGEQGSETASRHAVSDSLESSTVLPFFEKLRAASKLFRHGQHNTAIPLDGLGHAAGSHESAEASEHLRTRLGIGSIQITLDRKRPMRASSTRLQHAWIIEHLEPSATNPGGASGSNRQFQIEVGDVPSVMRALPDDIGQSAMRFTAALEQIVLGTPLESVQV